MALVGHIHLKELCLFISFITSSLFYHDDKYCSSPPLAIRVPDLRYIGQLAIEITIYMSTFESGV